jgi:hypothetical protein
MDCAGADEGAGADESDALSKLEMIGSGLGAGLKNEITVLSTTATTTTPRDQRLRTASSGIHTRSFFASNPISVDGITRTNHHGVPMA